MASWGRRCALRTAAPTSARGSLTVRLENRRGGPPPGPGRRHGVRGHLERAGLVSGPLRQPRDAPRRPVRRGRPGRARALRHVRRGGRHPQEALALGTEEGDDGYLGAEPVVLQVLADHGGGNPRKVRLDGSTYRIDSVRDRTLWDDNVDLRTRRGSHAFIENTGVVPDGKVYRVTRIDYRARLDPEKSSSSDFVLSANGKTLVEKKATETTLVRDTWTGEIDLAAGAKPSSRSHARTSGWARPSSTDR